jgi:hypothetical protein
MLLSSSGGSCLRMRFARRCCDATCLPPSSLRGDRDHGMGRTARRIAPAVETVDTVRPETGMRKSLAPVRYREDGRNIFIA